MRGWTRGTSSGGSLEGCENKHVQSVSVRLVKLPGLCLDLHEWW